MKTALITGASIGIGYELAKIFAKNKINIIVVSRNEKGLQEVVKELKGYGVEAGYYAKDLSNIENAEFVYTDLKEKNITIEYLVNNAGFGINGEYTDIPWLKEVEMFNLNMMSLAYFTKVFAKDMKQRKSGKILNVASTAAYQPGPYMAGYCATKAFVLSLSEAINFELKGSGVSITTLSPGMTDTNFHEVANTKNTILSKLFPHAKAADVARYGYKIMMRGKSSGVHGFGNKLVILSTRFSPRNMVTMVSAKLLKSKKE
jgi:uncharacterized protein